MSVYFYRDNSGKEVGPLELDALAKLHAAGVLNDNTLARLENSSEWKQLREFFPSSPAPQISQSSKKFANLTWAGLLTAIIIILVASHASNFGVQHAAEAEQSYRRQLAFHNNGSQFKLVSFKATSGQSFFKTNSFNADVIEGYKLNFEAEMEFEKDATENGIAVHQGDRAIYTGTMIGSETKDGWVFRLNDTLHILSASNPSLFSKLKDIEDTNRRAARNVAQANACINNLRQIDAAANQFALEYKKRTGDPINFPNDLTPYIRLNASGQIPSCPSGGTYTLNRVGDTPTCSLGNTVIPPHVLP